MYILKEFLEGVNREFLKRDEVVRGLAIGLITGSNVLLIGPPGTAKSMLVNSLAAKLTGIKYFSYLMTKFTRPDEIIGPISFKGLENDQLIRILEGRLADAHVAFLDEVFNANSGCLNAVLGIMNEKRVLNGTEVAETPLIMLVGATNDLPVDISGELSAFYDRFLLRYRVEYLENPDELQRLVTVGKEIPGSQYLTLEELIMFQNMAISVELEGEVLSRLVALAIELRKRGISISDRRIKQSCHALRAAALLDGRNRVSFKDLELLKHIFWVRPQDQEIFNEVWTFFQKPVLDRVSHITREAGHLFTNLMQGSGDLGAGTLTGTRLMELKEELLALLQLYEKDLCTAEEIKAGVSQVDHIVAQVCQNMFALHGGPPIQ